MKYYEVTIKVFPNARCKIFVAAPNKAKAIEKAFRAFKDDAVITATPLKVY